MTFLLETSNALSGLSTDSKVVLLALAVIFVMFVIVWRRLNTIQKLTESKSASPKAKFEQAPSPVATSSGEDEDEIAAVIAAAICAAEAENPTMRFRAVSFKRIH